MTMYIVRFVSDQGGTGIDGFFRDEQRAMQTAMKADKAASLGKTRFTFTDDFGIEIAINPSGYVRILTNTDASAALNKALGEANNDAARAHGVVPGSGPGGSSVH